MKKEPFWINDRDAIFSAAEIGDFETLKQLVQSGANLDVQNKYGETALITAIDQDYIGIAEYLIEKGADLNITDNDGDTALDFAKYSVTCYPSIDACQEFVDFLKAKGAKGKEGPSAKEQMWTDYYEAMAIKRKQFHDDRMFVLQVAPVTLSRDIGSCSLPKTSKRWAVITRRNVPGYPPSRTDDFHSREEAVAYLKKVAPQTPRVSLGGKSPDPPLSWDGFQDWLESIRIERLPY